MNSSHANDRTMSVAVTLRPSGGVTKAHEQRFRCWLVRSAVQWEIFEETVNDDDTTRHFHGRVLFADYKRMDKVKSSLIQAMGMVLAEKKVLQRGIKWLYDDWEYAGKDGHIWESNITDEDAWEYADPANKTVKQKNAEILYWLQFVREDLGPETTWQQIRGFLMPHFINGNLEMPFCDTLDKKCKRLALYYNFEQKMQSGFVDDFDHL